MQPSNAMAPYYVVNRNNLANEADSYEQARVAAIREAGQTGSASIYQEGPMPHAVEVFRKAEDSEAIISQLLCDHDPDEICPNIGDPL